MTNQNVIIGRIVDNPTLLEDNDIKYTTITISVPRSYKNENNEYDVDFISTLLTNGIAENTVRYCKKGSLIGIKGRLETRKVKPNEKIDYVTELVAEKVTFLSSSNGEKDENTTNTL